MEKDVDTVSGWIKLNRKIQDWEWYKDINVSRVFIHILITANYKSSRYMGYEIPVGSRVSGYPALAEQTGLTVQQVRTVISKLKSTSEITVKKTPKFSIISITNWDKYQDTNSGLTGDQQDSNRGATPSKEGKKVIREEEVYTAFESFVEFAKQYNLSVPAKLTKTRETKLKARLKDCDGLDGWKAALDKLKNSSFCMGKTGWKADFDFILQEKSFFKLMEGSYDDTGTNNKPTTKNKLASDTQLLLDRIRGSRAN